MCCFWVVHGLCFCLFYTPCLLPNMLMCSRGVYRQLLRMHISITGVFDCCIVSGVLPIGIISMFCGFVMFMFFISSFISCSSVVCDATNLSCRSLLCCCVCCMYWFIVFVVCCMCCVICCCVCLWFVNEFGSLGDRLNRSMCCDSGGWYMVALVSIVMCMLSCCFICWHSVVSGFFCSSGSPPVIIMWLMLCLLCCIVFMMSCVVVVILLWLLNEVFGVSHMLCFPVCVFHVHLRLHPDRRMNSDGVPASFPSPCIVPGIVSPVCGVWGYGLLFLSFVIGNIGSRLSSCSVVCSNLCVFIIVLLMCLLFLLV